MSLIPVRNRTFQQARGGSMPQSATNRLEQKYFLENWEPFSAANVQPRKANLNGEQKQIGCHHEYRTGIGCDAAGSRRPTRRPAKSWRAPSTLSSRDPPGDSRSIAQRKRCPGNWTGGFAAGIEDARISSQPRVHRCLVAHDRIKTGSSASVTTCRAPAC